MAQQPASLDVDRAALGVFRRSTTRVRLTIAFLAVAFVILGLGVLGAWQLQELANVAAARQAAQALQAALDARDGHGAAIKAMIPTGSAPRGLSGA